MPTPIAVLASEIMDSSAVLLNDVAKQVYTYVVQLPFLKISLKELREYLELNNVQCTNETSSVIAVDAGVTAIGFTTTPALPSDLVEIQELWERERNTDPFVPMVRKEFLPHYLEGEETSMLLLFEWSDNTIKFLPSNRNNDVKIDYIQQLFGNVTQSTSPIGVINSDSYLHFRTAALCAEFIGENKSRADELNVEAEKSLDRMTGIESKAKQSISTRHRPFRSSWKSRGLW